MKTGPAWPNVKGFQFEWDNQSIYPIECAPNGTSSNGSTWTTPAAMNRSATDAQMLGVIVNTSGLFVAVGTNGSTQGIASVVQ